MCLKLLHAGSRPTNDGYDVMVMIKVPEGITPPWNADVNFLNESNVSVMERKVIGRQQWWTSPHGGELLLG